MNTKMSRMIFAVGASMSIVVFAESGVPELSSNELAICAGRSDLVARVTTEKNEEDIRKPVEDGVLDLTVYGRLTALRIDKTYLWKGDKSALPEVVYIYEHGAGGGSFYKPILKQGEQYVVFLKRAAKPSLLTAGVATAPKLPEDHYFFFIGLPRQVAMNEACVDARNSNTIAQIDAYFGGEGDTNANKGIVGLP